MQLTTILATLMASAAVTAAPSPLDARQSRTTYVRLYNNGGCQEPWVEDVVFNQGAGTGCVNTGIAIPHQSANFIDSTTTCKLRVYNQPNCNDSGNFVELAGGFTGCQAIVVQSARFIC